ncbi:MAG: phosphatase PAP2 family protein [Parcubacteria group bacterium]|nr:phosphatase PAP2 family protein [Parcubacteria group bacterium]
MSFDAWVVTTLNKMIGYSYLFDLFWIFITSYFGYLLIVGTTIYWILRKKEDPDAYRNLLFIFCIMVLSIFVFTEGIRYFWYRPRPFFAFPDINVPLFQAGSSSFPSGHTATYFALAFGMYYFNKKIGGWYLLGAGLIAFSRIVLGVHYPSDIVGGVVIAWVSLVIIKHLFTYRFE